MDSTKPQAKYFFLHLGIIATLYIAVGSFLAFLFDVINYAFPDRQAYAFDPYSTSMRFSISLLIVVFPLFVYLSRLTHRLLVADPESRTTPVRRWLAYLTLFAAGAIMAGDLVVLINTFLSGEIGSRFVLKVISVLVVAAAVFWFTLRDLRGVYFERPKLLKLFAIIVSAVVVISLVVGIMIMGSPAKQRMLRDDMNRVSDLSSIQGQVLSYYYTSKGSIPQSLEDMKDDFSKGYYEEVHNDPVTGMPYEYRVVEGTSTLNFELCANFDLASRDDLDGRGVFGRGGYGMDYATSYPSYPGDFDQDFKHTEGRNCFTRSIDPVKHPIQNPERF